ASSQWHTAPNEQLRRNSSKRIVSDRGPTMRSWIGWHRHASASNRIRRTLVRIFILLAAIQSACSAALGQPPTSVPYPSRPWLESSNLKPSLGKTPRPSREERDQLRKYTGRRADPTTTLELRARRPRLWPLKQAPFRIQVGDESILAYS